MGATLRLAGLACWAVLAWFILAETVGWIPAGVSETWIRPLALSGAACLGAGIAVALLWPMARWASSERCLRCGSRTERGHSYCGDHLQEVVNEVRDRANEADKTRRSHRPRRC